MHNNCNQCCVSAMPVVEGCKFIISMIHGVGCKKLVEYIILLQTRANKFQFECYILESDKEYER